MSYDYLYRIVILGDSCAGKTSFMSKYVTNEKYHTPLPTIGVDFNSKIINGPDDKIIKIHLWDTSGHPNFRKIARSYFSGVAGAILLYNTGHRVTFTNLSEWIDDFKNINRYLPVPIMLVGAKFHSCREVSIEEAEEYAKKNNLLYNEVDFTNDEPIHAPPNDILSPLWNKIWNVFIKGNDNSIGVKKYFNEIQFTRRNKNENTPKATVGSSLKKIKNEITEHVNDMKRDCIIS